MLTSVLVSCFLFSFGVIKIVVVFICLAFKKIFIIMDNKNQFESKETLKERTKILLETRDMSDCTFEVGYDKVKVQGHKIFLAIASPAFYAMFFGELAEKGESIRIEDIEPAGFDGMMQYIYTDKVDFKSSIHACMVYVAARKYLLPFLETKCLRYMESNTCAADAVDVFEFSKVNNIPEVETICTQLFQRQTKDIVASEQFLKADIQTVEAIFRMESMNLGSEMELFKFLENWAYSEAERQKTEIDNLPPKLVSVMKHIRFLTMRGEEFASGPAQSPLLTTEEKLSIGMNIIKPGALTYPENLCTLTEYRRYDEERPEASFRYTVYNFSKLKDSEFSSPCYVRNLPWRIVVMPRIFQDSHPQKTLGFFLECNGQSKSTSWKCYATAELRVLAQKEGCEDYCRRTEHTYYCKENDWGFSQFMTWNDLLDPDNGFIKEDTLKLEVCVSADEPTGITVENKKLNAATSSIPLRRITRKSSAP